MSLYEKYVLPKFLNCACGSKPIEYQRKKVVPLAEGVVLEVGVGSGLNLPFYDMSKVSKLWGLDPSEELSAMAKEKARELGIEVNFVSSGAEKIPFSNNFFDTVLVTYTMCTIPEIIRANAEMKRVLKKTGKLIFCEHGLAPDDNITK
jgi:ubiquinone/menaquinone biosynthesis C-methylase UbiE